MSHDGAKLLDRRPVHEDPDLVRDVRGEPTLEAIAQPEARRSIDRLHERHERLGHAELDARLRQRRERTIHIRLAWMRDAGAIGLHVHAERAHLVELRKQRPTDRERPIGREDVHRGHGDAGWVQGPTLTVSFRQADQFPAASLARTAIVQVPVLSVRTVLRVVRFARVDHGWEPLRRLSW